MHPHSNMRDQAGFSLIELIIALTVMLIISAAVFSLMIDSIKVSSTTFEMTDAQESLRTAQEYISRDLITAGDGLKGINNIRLPLSFVTTYLTLNPITDPLTPGIVSLSIITSDNNVPASTPVAGTSPVVAVRADPTPTDRITILEIDPTFKSIALPASAINPSGFSISISPADVNKFKVGEIYFITSSVGATFGTITKITSSPINSSLYFAAGDAYGLNQPGNGGPINVVTQGGTLPASLMRMQIIHYFVNENGLLIRRVFGVRGAGFTDSVIAEHVTNLQFRYALNLRDANGNIQQPVVQLSTAQQQVAVRQVEVSITTETTHAIINGTRQPITMTTSTSIRNMQFRQALQPSSTN